ncbi:DUF4230 domain-containing protein [Clostridium senegalense]|uniref:DUF4230 domain-containing protein n=1 Tax=Clostridium senegalense TaxID=1465809 RepID=A0A6M0H491_9CLOT|nr:DUF4230 domain-containing protein [Clostridium senegalense]
MKKVSFKSKIIGLLIIVIVVLLFILSFKTPFKSHRKDSTETIFQQLVSINELVTVKYDYSNIISVKDNLKFNDIDIPFTEKSFVLKYDGYIKAGVSLKESKLKINGNKATLSIPNSKILDHVVIEDKISTLNEKNSLFNPLKSNEIFNEICKSKNEKENEIIDKGFLDEVNISTEKFLKDFFKNLGYDVSIKFY